jgi:hypothetical protein
MDETHLRFFDWATARALVSKAGYRLESAIGDGSLPLPYIRRLMPESFIHRIDEFSVTSFPGLFAHQFVMVAVSAKPPGE